MRNGGNYWDESVKNVWEDKGLMSELCTWPGRVAVAYLIGLVVCVVAGLASPDLFVSKQAAFALPDDSMSASSRYTFEISDYQRMHQSIYLAMRLSAPVQLQNAMELNGETIFETEGSYSISLYGSPQSVIVDDDACPTGCLSCPDGDESLGLTCELLSRGVTGGDYISCERGEEWCSWFSLYSINFVRHKTYYWDIEMSNGIDEYVETSGADNFDDFSTEFLVVYVSQWHTVFELVWYYSWLAVTLLVMFLPRRGFFTVAIRDGILWSKWSRLQKWVAVMLVSLFFFNNPFVAAQIFSESQRSTFIWFAIAEGTLAALLLLFWLDRLFDAGSDDLLTKKRVPRAAGAALMTLLYIVYVINMIDLRVSSDGNPDRVHKYPYTSTGKEKVLAILCFMYSSWVVALVVRAWWLGQARDKLRSNRGLQLSTLTALLTMLLLLPAVILEYLQPRVRGGVAFALAGGGINLYVITLALLYGPRCETTTNGETSSSGHVDEDTIPSTVNPMFHERGIQVVEETNHEPGLKRGGRIGNLFKGKRPKVQDTLWENAFKPQL